MTQANSNQTLSLKLTPMQVHEAFSASGGELTDVRQLESSASLPLLLRPGEPSEILVRLENRGNYPLHLNFQIEGQLSSEFYQIGSEGNILAPGHQMEAVLYFLVPKDFFEVGEVGEIANSDKPLMIDYRNYLIVSATEEETGRQEVQVSILDLLIRPHSLYLDFLPAFYREVDFIGRFLKIFEQSFEPSVLMMDTLWAYLDPLTAPQSLLPFIAYWVGWTLDHRLTLAQQRRLIRHAIELYRWRGTRRGLRLYLHLVTELPLDDHLPNEADKHIGIEDTYSEGFLLGNVHLNRGATLGGGQSLHFITTLRPDDPNQIDESLIRSIIEQEKPAFCTYELYIQEPSLS